MGPMEGRASQQNKCEPTKECRGECASAIPADQGSRDQRLAIYEV
eukprot:CAMPEP_0119524418 /NCGR_PEP_ID=MMETSP1344-20130328/39356_1 /TAXON_ID=236787 /ORGANISM="Florenciella parvula, Strain CCMP2471" /LENGTH=44 /DNA_ID= /DNA_START= /DNA_END= /DNA_ORIENTATION=